MLEQPRLTPVVHGSLEQQVQQLVSGYGGIHADVPALAAFLQRNGHGLRVQVVAPAEGQKSSPLTTRSITAPFIVVTAPGSLLQPQAQVVLVDSVVREHLAIAPSTPAYDRSLAALVPPLFVGSLARLHEAVALMASAAELSFRINGMELPPWRRRAALLHRWSRVARAATQLPLPAPAAPGPQPGGQSALSAALHSKDGSPRAAAPQAPAAAPAPSAPAEVAAADGAATKRQDSWGYGIEILDVDFRASDQDAAPALAKAKQLETVVGFAVGSAAVGVGRVPWGDKAAFVAALPRRSVFGADSEGADSEEMLGVSPLSVFRA